MFFYFLAALAGADPWPCTRTLFPATKNLLVEFTSVFLNAALMIIINGDDDLVWTYKLLSGVMERADVGMRKSLLGSWTFVGVELQQLLQQIQGVVGSLRIHVSQGISS